jgi:hypothetical protein
MSGSAVFRTAVVLVCWVAAVVFVVLVPAAGQVTR